MKSDKIINKAIGYYNEKKYSETIQLLEKEVFMYKNCYFYHYLLGSSYLRIGNLANAQPYLKKAYTLRPKEINIKQTIALLFIAQGKEDKATQIWLKMIEENENSELANKGLETIRKNSKEETIFWKNNNNFTQLFPEIKIRVDYNLTKILKIFLIISLLTFGFTVVILLTNNEKVKLLKWSWWNFNKTQINKQSNNIAAYIDNIRIENIEQIENNEGQFIFILTEQQITKAFNKIKKHLKEGNNNFARVEINKILNSNASNSIKLKAKNLASFISKPNFISFNEQVNFEEVNKNPILYKDTYIKWRGVVNNIEKNNDMLHCDFYIGYNSDVLNGIILTKINFDIDITFNDPVEILGQIKYNDNKLILHAIIIHKLEKEKF